LWGRRIIGGSSGESFKITEDGLIITQASSRSTGKKVFVESELKGGEGNFGHVSMKTSGVDGIYGSHWPGIERTATGMIKTGVKAFEDRTLDEDITAEEPFNPISVTLYSLNRKDMHNEYRELCRRLWSLKGSKVIIADTENCSSFVYKILSAGGINDLSAKCSALGSYFRFNPLEPKDLLECLLDAKRRELELYPETEEYDELDANDENKNEFL